MIDQLAERDLADFDFVIAGLLDVAAQAHDARAGVVRRAELGVFRRAHLHDVLHMAERLDVVDDGRAHPEAENRREIRRLDARIRTLAFQRFNEAGLFAADVGACAAMNVNLDVLAAAENVLAEEILRTRLVESTVQDARAFREFTADIDVGQLHVVREAGDDHALDELMRILVDDLAVLERTRLGFVRVADEINRLAAAAIDEAPLESARETRAAATTQTGELHVVAKLFLRRHLLAVGQILRGDGECFLQRFVAAVAHVAVDVVGEASGIDVLENESELLRHINGLTL